jgi:hypothetical protein
MIPDGPTATIKDGAGNCLDGAGIENDDAVTTACNGTPGQRWYLPEDGRVVNVANPQQCLDVFRQQFMAGTPVKLWDCNGGGNQTFSHEQGRISAGPAPRLCLVTSVPGHGGKSHIALGDCDPQRPNDTWSIVQ